MALKEFVLWLVGCCGQIISVKVETISCLSLPGLYIGLLCGGSKLSMQLTPPALEGLLGNGAGAGSLVGPPYPLQYHFWG